MNVKMILASLVIGLAGTAHATPQQPSRNANPAWGHVNAGPSWGQFVSNVKRAIKREKGHGGSVCR